MGQTVIGIFDNQMQAQQAVEALRESGISRDRIDISSSNTSRDGASREQNDDDDSGFGESVGRFFKSLFSDDDEVNKYSTVARRGTIVSVHSEDTDEATLAARILDTSGAVDVDDRFVNSGLQAGYDRDNSDRASGDTTSIPVVEERLNVGKREEEVGAVRIRSRIIEKPVEETLRLREQTVMIERIPVNRPATGADTEMREGELEIRKTREVPVVNKEARVVEEVNVRKDVREHEEVVRDTVRKKDVVVDEDQTDSVIDRTKDRTDDF